MASQESKNRNSFVAGLRQLHYRYWPAYKDIVGRHRYRIEGDRRYFCDCQKCGKRLTIPELKRDHIDPVGLQPDLVAGEIGAYCDRLFCGIDNYQILCEECHNVKSAVEGAENRKKRKEIKFNFDKLTKEDLDKCSTSANSTAQAESRGACKKRPSRGSKKAGKRRKSSV